MKHKLLILLMVGFCTTVMSAEKTIKKCAMPGDSAGGSAIGVLSCCEGYVMTNMWLHENYKVHGCNAPTPPGSAGSCIKCGDGICDTKNYEDKCSCPKDCH